MRTTPPRLEYISAVDVTADAVNLQLLAGSAFGFRCVALPNDMANLADTARNTQAFAYPVQVELVGTKGFPQTIFVLDGGWVPVEGGFTGIRVKPQVAVAIRTMLYCFQLADTALELLKNPPTTPLSPRVASTTGADAQAKLLLTDGSGRLYVAGNQNGIDPTAQGVLVGGRLDSTGVFEAFNVTALGVQRAGGNDVAGAALTDRLLAIAGLDGAAAVRALPIWDPTNGAPTQRLSASAIGVQLYDGSAIAGAGLDTGTLDLSPYSELTFLAVVGAGAARLVAANAIRDDGSSVVVANPGVSTPASLTQGWCLGLLTPLESTYVVNSSLGIRGFMRKMQWISAIAAASLRLTIWAR